MDKGIGDVRAYAPEEYPGIFLVRPGRSGRLATLSLVRRYLPRLVERDLAGHLAVVSERGLRVR